MANRFLNNITINDQYTFPSSDGTDGQVLSTTGAADGATELVFVDQSTLSTGSSRTTTILVKNISAANGGVSLSKGDPVYIYGSIGASERLYIDKADADSTATNNLGNAKMPCVGLLAQDLAANGEGEAVVTGKLTNLVTSPIDGSTPSENDTIYVKSGGGLTLTKPTGASNRIQNVGQVGRVSTSSDGNIVVSAILRSNDVPNLNTGKIWVGSATNTTESTIIHLDEASGEMGVGTNDPDAKLHIATSGESKLDIEDTGGQQYRFFVRNSDKVFGIYDVSNPLTWFRYTGNATVANTKLALLEGGGNVGIGTASPGYKLEVNGNAKVASGLYLDRTTGQPNIKGTGEGHIVIDALDASHNVYLNNYVSGDVLLAVGGGNVGIGTDSPAQKLEVSDSSATTIRIDNTKNSTWTVGEELGKLEWYGNDVSGEGPGVKGYIKLDSDNVFGAGFDMRFGTTDGTNGITERMVITRAGDVGVGVTTPVAKLHIGDGDGGSLFYINGQYNDVAFNGSTSGVDGVWSFINSATWDQTRFYVQDANNIDSRLTFRFTGNNGANEILAGSSTGNIGIGTTSPRGRLDVVGPLSVVGGTFTSGASGADSNGSSGIVVRRGKRILSGIPSGGNEDFYLRNLIWQTSSNNIEIGQAGTSLVGDISLLAGASGNIRFYASGSQDVVINSSGDVGIGANSPGSKLQIGDITTASNVAVRAISEQAYQAGFEAYGSGQGTGYMYVGQSLTYGGGVAYNGDGTPAAFDSGHTGSDKITFFRRENSADTAVMWYGYNSDDVNFRGNIKTSAYTIPNTAGTSGQVLAWPASGTTLAWADAGGGASITSGTFTPSVTASYSTGGFAPASGTMTGYYERVGDWVTVGFQLHFRAGNQTTFWTLTNITNLPYTVRKIASGSVYNNSYVFLTHNTSSNNSISFAGYAQGNTTNAVFTESGSATQTFSVSAYGNVYVSGVVIYKAV